MSQKKRITELENQIRRHQELYYNGQPEITDAEFDALWDELAELDPDNSLLGSIGADAADGWPKARHLIPMGSQIKASNPEDFLAWAAKVNHPEYLVQYKLDGASLELQYEKGRLVRAVTRGDGDIGDDISPNAVKMGGVVRSLPESFSGGIRGEVMMTHAVHEGKYADKANCRNAANGIMKRKDGSGAEDLTVICYDATGFVLMSPNPPGMEQGSPFLDELEKLEWLNHMGVETVPLVTCKTPEEVIEHRAHIMNERSNLPYDIDGLVVKGRVIDPSDMERARPEKQIAFKFSLEEAPTTLIAVEWSESGTNFTPIGIVEPVRLAGTTVQRANLCNTNIIKALDLMIGSRVIITKRGEIIPKIESLVENPTYAKPIPIPSVCSCNSNLVDEGTRLYCPNPDCPKKSLHRLEKWLSVLDIRDFGSAIVRKLHSCGRVRKIADLYTLTQVELAEYERMGNILARKILRNLASKSLLSLSDFIAGFDIEGIGSQIAGKAVHAGFDTLEKIRNATVEELDNVDGFAEITARTLVDGLAMLREEMDDVLATGIVTIAATSGNGTLANKSFCFTGELKSIKRSEAESLVNALGGIIKSSVTKNLSFLVTNDTSSGSEKNRKATAYGVEVIGEEAFLKLVGRI